MSQSGGFGSYITTKAMLAGLKLGWFVSTGNESDVNIAAVLRYLVDRDETKVLMVFAETVRDPDVFIDAACRAADLDKPIVLLKAGRSDAAAKAAMSHTASIVGSADVLDAVCRQYGVFVVSTMEEMLDLGTIFQDGRRVPSRGVGIMTSSGGAGVLLADAASAEGLDVPEIPADEQEAMMALMPVPFYGSLTNPVDTTAQVVAMPESFSKVLHAVGESRVVDMVAPVIWAVPGPQTDSVIEFYRGTDKPVALTSTAWLDELQVVGIPTYTDPHRAMPRARGSGRSLLADPGDRGPGIVEPEPGSCGRSASSCWPAMSAIGRCSSPPARNSSPATGSPSPKKSWCARPRTPWPQPTRSGDRWR